MLVCSWLGKIQVVKELLVDNAEKARPGLDALAYAYIYLQVRHEGTTSQSCWLKYTGYSGQFTEPSWPIVIICHMDMHMSTTFPDHWYECSRHDQCAAKYIRF